MNRTNTALRAIQAVWVLLILLQGLHCSPGREEQHNESKVQEEYPVSEPVDTGLSDTAREVLQPEQSPAGQESQEVLICKSKSAYAYHARICRGLKRCKAGTAVLSQEEAQEAGYRPCKYCY